MPRKIAVIDSETDPFDGHTFVQPFIWGFYDGYEYHEFKETCDLVEFLVDKPYVVYAHNGGNFDYRFMLDYLECYSEIMIINGRLAKFKIGKCEFRDSINIIPVPLKAGGQKDETFDYSLMSAQQREIPDNAKKISEYLAQDCVALYDLVIAFTKQFGRQLTQAGTAMRQWQKIAKKKPPKTNKDFYDQFFPFYYGGRVECFQKGIIEETFSVFDINSAYPYAMLHEHPFSVEAITGEGKPPSIEPTGFYEFYGVAKGSLPFRTEKGQLLFPRDSENRLYQVTGHEVIAAFDTESLSVSQWKTWHHFTEVITFADYIEKFWLMRQQAKADGDKVNDLFAKLLMNSLYGKWAANPAKYKRYLLLDPADGILMNEEVEYEDEPYCVSGELGPWLLAERGLREDEQRFYNVATGASITGFVRAYLWRAIHSCGLDNVLYCDTDSIATRYAGRSINEGTNLGAWKNEGQFIKAGIGGKKTYVFERDKNHPLSFDKQGRLLENKKASKGWRGNDEQLWRVARGEQVIYHPNAPTYHLKKPPTFVERKINLT